MSALDAAAIEAAMTCVLILSGLVRKFVGGS